MQTETNNIHEARHARCVLAIAGSDSGGNAGVQADMRMITAVYRMHCCCAITALTAQNPRGVSAIHAAPPQFVVAQLDSIFEMYDVAALKTGMLGSAEVVEAVAGALAGRKEILKVVDPVMVATSGARLIAPDALDALKSRLLPLANVITPNLPEAEILLGRAIAPDGAAMADAARELGETFSTAVCLKGGHAKNSIASDYFFDGREIFVYNLPWIENPVSTHGTGCSFAAALAAGLAAGKELHSAVEEAKRAVHDAILAGYFTGNNCGVLGMPVR